MVIRPMAAAYALGEIGRSAAYRGGTGGPASFFEKGTDAVALGARSADARLYSANPMFKMMGTVELMSEDFGFAGDEHADSSAFL